MLRQFSLFSVILIFLKGHCFSSTDGQDEKLNEIKNYDGRWFAVMASPSCDGGECNIFTNNKSPCQCIFIEIQNIGNSNYKVAMYTVNNATSKVTIDVGGVSCENNVKFKGFINSRATMNLNVLQKCPYGISETIYGYEYYYNFEMDIIAFNAEHKYMITTVSSDKFTKLTVVWCKVKTPSKKVIWTSIVQKFKNLKMDIHKLNFINQLNCVYSTKEQFNEIFFC